MRFAVFLNLEKDEATIRAIDSQLKPTTKQLSIRRHLQTFGTPSPLDDALRLLRERSERGDGHDGRRNLRLDAGHAQLRAHSPKAGGPGWPANEPARWQDAARRNATRSGESSLISPVVQRLELPKDVANRLK